MSHIQGWIWQFETIEISLIVSKAAHEMFDKHRQFGNKHECGGLLFVDTKQHAGLVLSYASPPNPKDKSSKFSLDLNPERCISETRQANEKGLRLIGYWHSHPQDIPEISPKDISSFRKLIDDNPIELPPPIAVIVGRNRGPDGIKAWLINGRQIQQAKFQALNTE